MILRPLRSRSSHRSLALAGAMLLAPLPVQARCDADDLHRRFFEAGLGAVASDPSGELQLRLPKPKKETVMEQMFGEDAPARSRQLIGLAVLGGLAFAAAAYNRWMGGPALLDADLSGTSGSSGEGSSSDTGSSDFDSSSGGGDSGGSSD